MWYLNGKGDMMNGLNTEDKNNYSVIVYSEGLRLAKLDESHDYYMR